MSLLVPALCLADGGEEILSIAFGGDVMLDRGVRRTIEAQGADAVFADVARIFARAHFAAVNLECPVTDVPSPRDKEYVFRV